MSGDYPTELMRVVDEELLELKNLLAAEKRATAVLIDACAQFYGRELSEDLARCARMIDEGSSHAGS